MDMSKAVHRVGSGSLGIFGCRKPLILVILVHDSCQLNNPTHWDFCVSVIGTRVTMPGLNRPSVS